MSGNVKSQGDNMLKIKVIKAFDGDCILISFIGRGDKVRNILIDGGTNRTYHKNLKPVLKSIKDKEEYIDLLIVTHIHDDHVGGIVELYQDDEIDKNLIKKVWFNSKILLKTKAPDLENFNEEINLYLSSNSKMGMKSANTLENELRNQGHWEEKVILFGDELNIDSAKITVLSPTINGIESLKKVMQVEEDETTLQAANKKDYEEEISDLTRKKFVEDTSDTNRTSIALILEYDNNKLLLLGDCWPSDIVSSLQQLGYSNENKLKIDYFKISHHASKKNTSEELLDLIDCENFIVSTDGSKHGHPNKEALARIIHKKSLVNLYFNYDIYNKIFTKEEIDNFKFQNYEVEEIEV